MQGGCWVVPGNGSWTPFKTQYSRLVQCRITVDSRPDVTVLEEEVSRPMTIGLIDKGWDKEFAKALSDDASELRIICPFMKADIIGRLLSHHPRDVQVITRFNLADFAEGVSDVAALRSLLDGGARVRGVRNLHAKLYLFGTSRAIIGSANLTKAAFGSNHELGVVARDQAIIVKCRAYFDNLWNLAGADLRGVQVDAWDHSVTSHRVLGEWVSGTADLQDFGEDVGVAQGRPVYVSATVSEASQAFVKFLGTSRDRAPLSKSTISEIAEAECHWAVAYPAGRRPRSARDGAVIFVARLTRDPNDIRIFGRAIGMKYHPGRDDATPTDIERRPWKEKWSRYIRVHQAEFVAGTMENGISLNRMMEALSAGSFASTRRNASRGSGNTDPRKAYLRRPDVELSPEGVVWLNRELQTAFESHGKVSQGKLRGLDWPDSSIIASGGSEGST